MVFLFKKILKKTFFSCDVYYSAKRAIVIACRLSVCNVGGSGSHRLEILKTNCTIDQTNTFAPSSPKAIHLLAGEHGEILRRLEVRWGKWRAGAQKRQYL